MNTIYDMETADPDDAFTLCLLASHPKVQLRAVTVTPGSKDQVGLVRHLLFLLGRTDVTIGSRNLDHPKQCVSEFHYKWLGKVVGSDQASPASDVIYQTYQAYPDCVLITGAALHNPKNAILEHSDLVIPYWFGQGGFAGDSIVPKELRLEKFDGLETCPTFNFNGDVPGALLMLSSEQVRTKYLISKNVCHGVVYDQQMHKEIETSQNQFPGLKMIFQGMEVYLQKNGGKKFHDPLAACSAIELACCTFEPVEVYREKGKWGSRKVETPNAQISIAYDRKIFLKTLCNL